MHTLIHEVFFAFFGGTTLTVFLVVADALAVLSTPSVLIQRRSEPLAALGWLFGMYVVPYLGVISWWALGRPFNITRKKRRESTEELEKQHRIADVEADSEAHHYFRGILPRYPLAEKVSEGVFPPTTDNEVRLLVDGDVAFPELKRQIEAARAEINLLFYIWANDQTGETMRDLLVKKAEQGVTVRLLVDAVGSPDLEGQFAEPLREAGAEVELFLPAKFRPWAPTINFRNHRKLAIIDRRVAFAGGMNVGNDYVSRYHDVAFMIEGPAVRQLNNIFRDDWFFTTDRDPAAIPLDLPDDLESEPQNQGGDVERTNCACTVVASIPDREDNHMHDTIFLAISKASQRVWLTTPYFVPGPAILTALRTAARRGVDVRLILPFRNDVPIVGLASRSYYRSLVNAGVRIFEYDDDVLHAKSIVVDKKLSILGSANIDIRSLELDFELGCLLHSARMNTKLSELFERNLEKSEEISRESLEHESLFWILAESTANLFSPLL